MTLTERLKEINSVSKMLLSCYTKDTTAISINESMSNLQVDLIDMLEKQNKVIKESNELLKELVERVNNLEEKITS